MVAIGDDVTGFRDMARPMIALYVGGMGAKGKNFYNDLVCRYGFEDEAAEIQDLYLDGKKDEAAAKVPDALLEATSLCGPEGYVKEQDRRLRRGRCHRTSTSSRSPPATRPRPPWSARSRSGASV